MKISFAKQNCRPAATRRGGPIKSPPAHYPHSAGCDPKPQCKHISLSQMFAKQTSPHYKCTTGFGNILKQFLSLFCPHYQKFQITLPPGERVCTGRLRMSYCAAFGDLFLDYLPRAFVEEFGSGTNIDPHIAADGYPGHTIRRGFDVEVFDFKIVAIEFSP